MHAHILSGKSKCIGGLTSREMCVLFEFHSAFAQMESEQKHFGFLKEG